MASMFSAALQISDLNDFITPSQECIKPINIQKKGNSSGSILISEDGEYYETNEGGSRQKLEKAKITLNDCLACSGCITSAESVLISQQSHEEFYRILNENKIQANNHDKMKVVVVSISPQSTASLGAKYHLSFEDTARRLQNFFYKLGVKFVFDTTIAREFALIENQKEFVYRYKVKDIQKGMLPMLSSACPGWICYAEKTHGDYILPYLSSVKSPQQIMGSLIKDYLAQQLCIRPDQIYHTTVMPCFDKKLEASRNDFYSEKYDSRDVDCVITSIEVEAMLEKEGVRLDEITSASSAASSQQNVFGTEFYSHKGSASGAYCDQIFLYAAKELFGEEVVNMEYKTLRNQDLKEIVLEKNGEVLLRFAIANGFRNIQNIVQKLKRGKSTYHFVEVMACPSGCINGGAQVRAVDETPKELLSKVEEIYHSLPARNSKENAVVQDLYERWLEGEDSLKCKQMLYTQYHAVEKISSGLLIKW
ncbi:cytosolic iron-sulfur assembly component 3-like isoform X2 [Uloborus diversus]|uniref:cytosolic iron-sulfur assembly component 3-like isoform X2 n=1 Tax=Uloborus diversus TaxID=327109 RepID=UPI00240A710D|nr:cytosolic iron-sulfur assembly component 3-like isoform X2 [Uloborus diversus]